MDFLPKEIEQYALDNTSKESDLLSQLNRETWAKVIAPRMLSGHLQGRILSLFSKLIQPKNILEIGTYTGYSALALSEGLQENGTLHTIDCNEEVMDYAKKYFHSSPYRNNILTHLGEAMDIIPKLNMEFQMVFIDADKENYCQYYDLVFDKLSVGGLIIADNVLWSGKVVKKNPDTETLALMEYAKKVQQDKRVENLLLPVRDGLLICRKLSQ